jgi:DNA modification methylase
MRRDIVSHNNARHEPGVRTPEHIIEEALPAKIRALYDEGEHKAIPQVAKDKELIRSAEERARALPSRHLLIQGDSRRMDDILDESVQLAVTSPPYWTLKKYLTHDDQLGAIEDYEMFLEELDEVWRHVYRVLSPGGRLIVVVGDVCLSRRQFGRHVVVPLHAGIQEHCRTIGFDNLAPIIWRKIANSKFESKGNGAGFLGKPYEPNAIIKNDIEYILFQRKSGGYRKPSAAMRGLSAISEKDHKDWFQQVWSLGGASTRQHPAPYPLAVVERLIRMFSFVGDVVLDPFAGTGTTSLAAANWGRNSIGIEVEPSYYAMALGRLEAHSQPHLPLYQP